MVFNWANGYWWCVLTNCSRKLFWVCFMVTNTYKWSCSLPFQHSFVYIYLLVYLNQWVIKVEYFVQYCSLNFSFLSDWFFSCIVSGLIWKNSFSFLYDSLLIMYFLFSYVFPVWNTILFKIFIICIIFRSFLFFPSIFWDMNIRNEPSIQVKLLMWLHLSPYTIGY